MCDYETSYIDTPELKLIEYKCPHHSIGKADEEGMKYCIFHSRREDKDVEKFYKGFKELYKKGEHEFTSFVFPKDFSFTRLSKETGGVLKFFNAVFDLVIFLCEVDFNGAEFSGHSGASFFKAMFLSEGRANFIDTKFIGEGLTNFSLAQFTSDISTSFNWAEFFSEGGTYFFGAVFSGKGGTDFWRARFLGGSGTSFSHVLFSGERGTDFSFTQFSGKGGTDFSKAKYLGEGKVSFAGELFSEETEVDFRDVSFETPENVTFDLVNLAKCQFVGTDLERVNIKEVFWTNKKPESKWRLGRIKVYDDTLQSGTILNRKGEKNHYRVYQLYNQLLLNYERTYRHHEAGDFYAGQMDMRRRGNLDRKIFSQILLTLYKVIAEYGERPVRVLVWLLFTLLFFGLIYAIIGIEGPSIFADGGFLNELFEGVRLSLDTMTLGKIKFFNTSYSITNSNTALLRFLEFLQVVLGTSLLTLFLLSVRRRFRKV